MRVEHTIEEFRHELAQLTPMLEQALRGDEPWINYTVPPAVTTQQEIVWLHGKYCQMLNADDFASEENGLPRDFETREGEHFFHAKIMIVRRSESYFKETRPQELLERALNFVRQLHGNMIGAETGTIHPNGVAVGERYDTWLWALREHKEKWVKNWSGASRWVVPEGWDVAKVFDEEMERVRMERAEQVGRASMHRHSSSQCRMQ